MSASPMPAAAIADAAAAARQFLRLADGAEQALLERLALTALALGEAYTGCAFIARAHEDVVAPSTTWRPLLAAPVRAIQGVTALPDGAAPFVLEAASWSADIDVDGGGWVRVTRTVGAARIAVSYSAGLAVSWAALPAPVAQACVALIAHLFAARDGAGEPPAAVAALWRPWRRMRLAGVRP